MGFLICPKCSQQRSDDTSACPHCGYVLPSYYAPAPFAKQPGLPAENTAPPEPSPFFAVSLLKLVVLGTCTFGFYLLCWFYQNWNLIKKRHQLDLSPFWRSFFAPLFCYFCFERIRVYGNNLEIGSAPPMGLLAIGYFLFSAAWRLPEPYNLLVFLNVFFIVPVQSYANRINLQQVPTHDPNSRFSLWNWVVVVLGGVVFLLAVIGSFMPANKV